MPDQWCRNVHRRVLDELERHFVNPGTMSSDALQMLTQLRAYRVHADYELDIPISEQDVRNAVNLLEAYIHECHQILR